MKYLELVHNGAPETELQEQLAGDDMTTITMRILRNLKEAGPRPQACAASASVPSSACA